MFALDTNILAYAEGLGDPQRCGRARDLVAQLPQDQVLLASQTLGELFTVLIRKAKRDATDARMAVLSWADTYPIAGTNEFSMFSAMDLAADHQLQIWDALILTVAADNHCRFLLSEDLQDGFIWRGATVINPFDDRSHAKLQKWLPA